MQTTSSLHNAHRETEKEEWETEKNAKTPITFDVYFMRKRIANEYKKQCV